MPWKGQIYKQPFIGCQVQCPQPAPSLVYGLWTSCDGLIPRLLIMLWESSAFPLAQFLGVWHCHFVSTVRSSRLVSRRCWKPHTRLACQTSLLRWCVCCLSRMLALLLCLLARVNEYCPLVGFPGLGMCKDSFAASRERSLCIHPQSSWASCISNGKLQHANKKHMVSQLHYLIAKSRLCMDSQSS